MGDEDGLTASETIPLVLPIFSGRASSNVVHFRLVEPTEHPSSRVEIAHGDGWEVEVLLRSPPIAFHLSFRGILLVVGLPDAVVLCLTTRAVPLLGRSLVAPWADVHDVLHSESCSRGTATACES